MRRLQWAAAVMLVGLLEVIVGAWELYVSGNWQELLLGMLLVIVAYLWQRREVRRVGTVKS